MRPIVEHPVLPLHQEPEHKGQLPVHQEPENENREVASDKEPMREPEHVGSRGYRADDSRVGATEHVEDASEVPPVTKEEEWPRLVPPRDNALRTRREHQPSVERKETYSAWTHHQKPLHGDRTPARSPHFERLGKGCDVSWLGLQSIVETLESQVRTGISVTKQAVEKHAHTIRSIPPREQFFWLLSFLILYPLGPFLMAILLIVGRGREWTERSTLEQIALAPFLFFGGLTLAILWWIFSPLVYVLCWGAYGVSLIRPVGSCLVN